MKISPKQTLLGIPCIGNNYYIIVEEVDGVNNVRVNLEAGPGVTGYMVERALKGALGFSPKGDVVSFRRAAQTGRKGQEGVSRANQVKLYQRNTLQQLRVYQIF